MEGTGSRSVQFVTEKKVQQSQMAAFEVAQIKEAAEFYLNCPDYLVRASTCPAMGTGVNYTVLFFVLLLYSCSGNKQQNETSSSGSFTTNDTIPPVRKQVSKSPVASYIIPVNNPLLHQYFGVKVYETSATFRFY